MLTRLFSSRSIFQSIATMQSSLQLAGILLLMTTVTEAWQPGFIGVDETEKMKQFDADVAKADESVRVTRDDQLDINIAKKTFSLDELQRYFELQRHKDFIVVTYDKNAPSGDLKESLEKLKSYFHKAGYKRVLLTHGHSSGVIIREDSRVSSVEKP